MDGRNFQRYTFQRYTLAFIENGSHSAQISHAQSALAVTGVAPVLVDNSARAHRVDKEFLPEVEFRRLDWPALSADLNPIEHVEHSKTMY